MTRRSLLASLASLLPFRLPRPVPKVTDWFGKGARTCRKPVEVMLVGRLCGNSEHWRVSVWWDDGCGTTAHFVGRRSHDEAARYVKATCGGEPLCHLTIQCPDANIGIVSTTA